MYWQFTTINHRPQREYGLTWERYGVLYYIYKTQIHYQYGDNGWTTKSAAAIGKNLVIAQSTIKDHLKWLETFEYLERAGTNREPRRRVAPWIVCRIFEETPKSEWAQIPEIAAKYLAEIRLNPKNIGRNPAKLWPKSDQKSGEIGRNPAKHHIYTSNSIKEINKGPEKTGFNNSNENPPKVAPPPPLPIEAQMLTEFERVYKDHFKRSFLEPLPQKSKGEQIQALREIANFLVEIVGKGYHIEETQILAGFTDFLQGVLKLGQKDRFYIKRFTPVQLARDFSSLIHSFNLEISNDGKEQSSKGGEGIRDYADKL
jgi:hypothetical protein